MKRVGIVIALLAVAACSSGKSASQPTTTATTATRPQYTPVFTKGACNEEVPVNARIECGTLTVPEDRSKPTGRTVVLPVAIVHADDPNPAPDPILYLSGGPGDAGLTSAAEFLDKRRTGTRDAILFDQRGTGAAQPSLDCPEVHEATATILGAADSFDAESTILNDAVHACLDRLQASGVDPDQYNTVTTADDVADLRIAMGIREWNLYGVSYGTTVALATMRAHPEGVRSATLDSVVPTDVGVGAPELARSFERARRVFFDGCAKDTGCHAAHPNLEADTAALLQSLDAAPYKGSIDSPTLHRSTPITVTGADVAAGLFEALYDESLIAQLPTIISLLQGGLAGPILDQIATQGIKAVNTVAEAETLAVLCHDRATFVHADDDKRVLAEHPDDSTLLLYTAVRCADFSIAPAPQGFNDPVRSDIPSLVLAGEYDPVTPPEQSKHASETLSHSTFVEFPGLGHGEVSSAPDCPSNIFRAFLADPTAAADTSCVAQMGSPF